MAQDKSIPQKLKDKFFTDPDWSLVEDILLDHIRPLTDMSTIDTTQTAETVKAEVIGRRLAFNAISQFLEDTQIVSGAKVKEIKNPFQ